MTYVYVILAIGWLSWMMPFVVARRRSTTPAQAVDRRARWGILLVGLGFAVLWQNPFWLRSLSPWRIAPGIALLAMASLFSWTATRTLGRQWRLDAGLNAEHELVISGPYRLVRHPIYTSMLALLLGSGLLLLRFRWLLLAAVLVLAGSEIRVRIEEKLLAARFGERFRDYQRAVPAYVPLLKVLDRR
jgi:protein-S-isoprenylcysteine O-methyltransferase Ste14